MENEMKTDFRAVGNQYRADSDLARHIPMYPKFNSSIGRIIKNDFAIFYGGAEPIILHGSNITTWFYNLIELLDGNRKLDDLKDNHNVYNLICFLHSSGLLEDGNHILGDDDHRFDADRYLARGIGLTRIITSREELWRAINKTNLLIIGDPYISQLLVTNCKFLSISVINEFEHADLVIVCRSDNYDCTSHLAEASLYHKTILIFSFDSSEFHIGPMFYQNGYITPECYLSQSKTLSGSCGHENLIFAISVCSEYILALLGKQNQPPISGYNVYKFISTECKFERRTVIKEYYHDGSQLKRACYGINEDVYIVLKHHSDIQIPPFEYWSKRIHQNHYSSLNLLIASEPPPLSYANESISIGNIFIKPDLENIADRDELLLNKVGLVLRIMSGYSNTNRRISPSSGNMQSPLSFVISINNSFLGDGVYHYNAIESKLDRVNKIRSSLFASLDLRQGKAYIIIVLCGNLLKVRQKYSDRAFNLTLLDCGISSSFGAELASVLGLSWSPLLNIGFETLIDELHLSNHTATFCIGHVAKLDLSYENFNDVSYNETVVENHLANLLRSTGRPHSDSLYDRKLVHNIFDNTRLDYVLDLYENRRSCREFSEIISDIDFSSMVNFAYRRILEYQNSGFNFGLKLYVILQGKTIKFGRGLYGFCPIKKGIKLLKNITDQTLGGQIIFQEGLAAAPVIFVFAVDFEQCFGFLGAAGYRVVIGQIGMLIGGIWLEATKNGLSGCPAGAYSTLELAKMGLRGPKDEVLGIFCVGHKNPFRIGSSAGQSS